MAADPRRAGVAIRRVAGATVDRRRGLVLAVLVLSVVGMLVPPIAAGQGSAGADADLTRGEPGLDVFLPDDEVTPGQETALELEIGNDGEITDRGPDSDRVLTARGVTVEIVDGGPFGVKSGETPIGGIPDGEAVPVAQRIVVPEDVEPGEYEIDVEVSYSYLAATGGPVGDRKESETETFEVTVVVPDEPRFAIVDTDTDLEPGASGEAEIEVENVGTETATAIEGTFTGESEVVFGTEGAVTESLGELAPGESTTVTADASLGAGASDGEKPFEAVFTYDDRNGVERTAEPIRGSLAPLEGVDFSVDELETTLAVGYDGEVTATVRNDGPRTVEGAVVRAEPGTESLGFRETGYALPALEPGESADVRYRVDVPDGADEGPRQLRFTVEYPDADGGTVASDPVDERVVVDDRVDEFAIVGTTTDVEPGASGEAEVEIENRGPETVHQLRTTLSGSGGLTIGDGASEELLGSLAPGESATMAVDVAVAESVGGGEKPIEAAFTYRDERGIEQTGETVTGGLTPADSQEFAVENVADTLAVGYDGEITGELRNDGPRAVDDAVLIVEPMSDSLFVEDTRYALPELEPGESTDFRYPTDVSGQADEGPRQVRFTVEYTGGDRTTLTSDPISKRVVVDPRADEFSLEGVQTSVAAGDTDELVIEITNERPETLSNVDAMLYTDSPLSSDANEQFVPELAPGESAEISFEIAADDGARETTYPVELDFEYRTERGSTELSDTYQFPVDVVANEDSGGGVFGSLGVPLAVLLVLTTLGAGAAVWSRRR